MKEAGGKRFLGNTPKKGRAATPKVKLENLVAGWGSKRGERSFF